MSQLKIITTVQENVKNWNIIFSGVIINVKLFCVYTQVIKFARCMFNFHSKPYSIIPLSTYLTYQNYLTAFNGFVIVKVSI